MTQGETKTFLLGVGCQKGGTTWLHDHLRGSSQVDLGMAKEYHVFDALDLDFAAPYAKKARARARRALNGKGDPGKAAEALRRLEFQLDPESYFDYFQFLLARDPGVRLTADITPSYAGLSAERFGFIREGFLRRGLRVRVIFLMRDPVERIWSAVRMNYREQRLKNPDAQVLGKSEEASLLEAYKRSPQAVRTRYDRTMAQLEKVFAPEELHYEFYERLFTEEAVRRIEGFLGIDAAPPDFGRRSNASPKSGGLSEAAMREVAQAYAPVYADAAARFGQETMTALWPGMRLL